jgi:hypothetical protein
MSDLRAFGFCVCFLAACPAPPPASVTVAQADADVVEAEATPLTLDKQAEQCLESPMCSAAEVGKLFHAAASSKLAVGCFVFGRDGAVPDPVAERACLERDVSANDCRDGGSPSLAVLHLAVLLADAAPPDFKRARALLAPCFQDMAVKEVLGHIAAKERDGATPALESCDKYAMTTLSMVECFAEHAQTEDAWIWMARKRYDTRVGPLFDAAAKAHAAYAAEVGAIAYEKYAGGTMRDPAMRSEIARVLKRRRVRLAQLPAAPSKLGSAEQLAQQTRVDESELRKRSPELKTALDASDAAFDAYRHAELALYAALNVAGIDVALGFERVEDLDSALTP